jgi:predicted RNase H-like HicB family nuclease
MFNPASYSIVLRFGVFDGEECFEARVLELTDVAEYADTYVEAYELALDTIRVTAKAFSESGKLMPAPLNFKI